MNNFELESARISGKPIVFTAGVVNVASDHGMWTVNLHTKAELKVQNDVMFDGVTVGGQQLGGKADVVLVEQDLVILRHAGPLHGL